MILIKGLKKWILPIYRCNVRDYETRITILYGGAGSGKSVYATQKITLKALQSKRKILVVRKVGRTLKDSVFSLFVETLNQLGGIIRNINKSDFTITLVNGSEFLFKGLDDPEKIKSINGVTDIFIEEATELTIEDFSQLNLRLRSKEPNNQIILCFNPVSKANWCYKYFFENGSPDDCVIIHTTYKDNIFLPKEYIETLEELEKRNPAYYRIYALGEFATLDKLIFPVITKRIITQEEIKDLPSWCGMDFGYTNDPTAINWGYIDNINMKLYIYGEYDKKSMTNDVIANTIKDLGLSKGLIIADCAEPKSIMEIKRLGVNRIVGCEKGKDSIINGIDRLQRYEIIINENCLKTIEEFENYTWKKDKSTGEYINEPVDAFNHHIDAIRYGVQFVIGKKTIQGVYKSPFEK